MEASIPSFSPTTILHSSLRAAVTNPHSRNAGLDLPGLFKPPLPAAEIPRGSRLGRNRFDLPGGRYGVLYTAEDLETCVLEVFGDRWLKERLMAVAALFKVRGSDLCCSAGAASGRSDGACAE
jgi:RES domain-containing protein